MAVKTFYLTNTVATAPGWHGIASETNPAIADTNSRVTVGKIAINQYVLNFMMAGVSLTAQNITPGASATSIIDARSAPVAGTSAATASTTGDSVRTEAPLTGDFPAGNWTITWAIRSNSTSTWQGRVRTRVWRSANADGSGATLLSSSTILGASTGSMINATTIYTSSATWAAPAISLNNEYLFFQIEFQELVAAGSANASGGYLRTSQSFVTTTNFTAGAVNQTVPPGSITSAAPALAAGTVTQDHVIDASALATAAPILASGATAIDVSVPAGSLATASPILVAGAISLNFVVALTGETVGALTLPTLVTTTAASLQYLTPMADVNLGGWTNETGGTSLYGSIDEAAPNVADYIRSSLDPVNDSCVFELSDPAAPLAAPVTVSYLYGKETNNADKVNLTARLLQGATVIAVWVHADIPYTATQADQLLTAPQRAAIGDASALRLEFIANPAAANFVTLRDGSAVTDRAGNPITLRA